MIALVTDAMPIFYIIVILFAAYCIKQFYAMTVINKTNKRKLMETLVELRHHRWLQRTGMREHAGNFNTFGLRRTIRKKRSSGGGIAPV